MFKQSIYDEESIRVSVGHWTNDKDLTGCTVILFDRAAPAVVDVRGGAPGTRETSLLGRGDLVQAADAIVLTGGSAFGLGAADGVMRFLRERGRGVETPAGPVPIVPTAVLFDLGVGSPTWPTAESGYDAAVNAVPLRNVRRGPVGAGRGATTGKILGDAGTRPGGFGFGVCEVPGAGHVFALSAVNAAGMIQIDDALFDPREVLLSGLRRHQALSATTLTVVLVDVPSDTRTLTRVAISAHDGLARMIVPCHTIFDGDIVFAAGLRLGQPDSAVILQLSIAAELAVERSIVDALTQHPAAVNAVV